MDWEINAWAMLSRLHLNSGVIHLVIYLFILQFLSLAVVQKNRICFRGKAKTKEACRALKEDHKSYIPAIRFFCKLMVNFKINNVFVCVCGQE